MYYFFQVVEAEVMVANAKIIGEKIQNLWEVIQHFTKNEKNELQNSIENSIEYEDD